jgi:hypothetical protein
MWLSSNVPLVLVLCCECVHDQEKKSDRNIQTDHWNSGLGQPRHEFLNVSNPENLSERRPESGVIPEVEVETKRGVKRNVKYDILSWSLRVIKSFPLLDSEELAKLGIPEGNSLEGFLIGGRVANRGESAHLIRAHHLHGVDIFCFQFDAV